MPTRVGPDWVWAVLDLFGDGRKSKEEYRYIADWLRELEDFYSDWAAPRRRGAPKAEWVEFSGPNLKQLRETIPGVDKLPGGHRRKRSSHAAVADFCHVSVDTVQSWERQGRAQAKHFVRVVVYLRQHLPDVDIEAELVKAPR